MTLGGAREIAIAYLASISQRIGIELAIIDSATIEKSYGWIFFYQSKHISNPATSAVVWRGMRR